MTDSSAASNRDLALQELIAAYLDAEAECVAPETEAWLAQHPDFAEELRQFLADHQRMAAIGRPLRDAALQSPGSVHPTMDSAHPSGPTGGALGTVRYFGEYELLAEIARGGMGVVYKARQVKLGRIVAVKMILAGHLAGESEVQRFYTEARAAAKLHHPNIVAIHEVGQHDGQHYYSMDYVEGESLAERIARSPLSAGEAATLMKTVALAVSFAHVESVVHRDLKPANILLDRKGEPHVTDFGLAKLVSGGAVSGGSSQSPLNTDHSPLTHAGSVLGTPSYMPPEQASGNTAEIGPHSDIYSLGAVLYCALTGRPPFQAASPVDTLRQVLDSEPVPPRTLNAAVPRDLETICLKCLEKEPRRRYASAPELVDELERYLEGKPIQARPATKRERLLKWVRRRPAAAALIGVSTAASVGLVALGISLVFNAQQLTEEAVRRETAERERANLLTAQLATARGHVYTSGIALADQAREKHDSEGLRGYLNALRPQEGETDLRGFEWYYLWQKNSLQRLSLPTVTFPHDQFDLSHPEFVDRPSDRRRLVFSPDGKFIATTKHVCDAATGRTLVEFDEAADKVFFSFDNKYVSAGDIIVDLTTRKKTKLPLPRPQWHRDGADVVFSAAAVPLGFLAEGNALVALHTGEKRHPAGLVGGPIETEVSLKSYDPATGKETVHEFQVRPGYRIITTAFCEQRGLLAVASAVPFTASSWVEKDEVEVWDLINGGRKFYQFEKAHEKAVWGNDDLSVLLFSPDGSTLAVMTRDKVIRLCDPDTGQERMRLNAHWRRYLAFSQDSKTLLSLGRGDSKLEIWDVATGKELVSRPIDFAGHPQSLGARPEVALSPDGKTYATGGGEKIVQLWDTATGKLRATLLGHQHPIRDLTFSPDGKTLATRDLEQRSPTSECHVKLWDTGEESPAIGLPLDPSAVTALAASPAEKTVAVGFDNGTIRLCEAHSLKVVRELHNKPTMVDVLLYSSDGQQLAASHAGNDQEKNIDIWDLASGKVIDSYPGYLRPTRVFDGKLLAAASGQGGRGLRSEEPLRNVILWDMATQRPRLEIKDATLFALTADGALAAAGWDSRGIGQGWLLRLKLWEVATGQDRLLPHRFGNSLVGTSALRFSPDGKYLAICSPFLETLPGEQEGTIEEPGKGLRLYDVATGKEHAFLPMFSINEHLPADAPFFPFSPDSKFLLTIEHDKVELPNSGFWDSVRNKIALRDVATLKELATLDNLENLTCVYAAFSPDGRTLAALTIGEWTRDQWLDGKFVPDAQPRMKGTIAGTHGSSGSGADLRSMHPVYEIHLWDVGALDQGERPVKLKAKNRFFVSWQGSVDALVFSGDGQSLYTIVNLNQYISGVAPLNRMQVWDVATGQERGSVGDHGTRFHALAFARDGRLLAVTQQQLNVRRPEVLYKVRVWDVASQKELTTPQTVAGLELPLDLDAEAMTLTSNTPSQSDDLFSPGAHSSTAISPDGKVKAVRGYTLPLQTTGPDGKLKIVPSPTDVVLVDVKTGEVLHALKSYGQWVSRLAFSPDGKTLAVGESSGKIHLWNVAAGRLLLSIPAHAEAVTGLAFRADGRLLASSSGNEIRLWHAADEAIAFPAP